MYISKDIEKRTIYANEDYVLYCSRCDTEYDHIIAIVPIKGYSEYFVCKECNFTELAKEVKMRKVNVFKRCFLYKLFNMFC